MSDGFPKSGGFLIHSWTDEDMRLSVEAGKTRQINAVKQGRKSKRGLSKEDDLLVHIEGCLCEKMFNRVMGFSEVFTPYVPDVPDSEGWEIKGSWTWRNMLVPQKEMKYPKRPICRVRLIRQDKLAIVGGWCFIRDVPKLSYRQPPDRHGHKGGYLINPQELLSVVPFEGVHGEEVFSQKWWTT